MSANPAFDWLSAITLVGVTEATVALSFLPAFRHHWRRWKGIDWTTEWPYMWPPFFLGGLVWFTAHLVNALGVWFVLRQNSTAPEYHACLALWTASLAIWSLWAIPWEMELPLWTLVAWACAGAVSIAATVMAWVMPNHSVPGAVLLTVYTAWVVGATGFNVLFLVGRSLENSSGPKLHQRIGNPFAIWAALGGWPPLNA